MHTEIIQSICSSGVLTSERPDNPDSDPEGPFFPGEKVKFSYNLEFLIDPIGQGNNCQWLQGLIPSFGAGWDLVACTPVDQGPEGGWFWLAEGAVEYDVTSNNLMLQPSPHGAVSYTHLTLPTKA